MIKQWYRKLPVYYSAENIYKKILKELEPYVQLREEQFGFHSVWSTTDAVFIICQIAEKEINLCMFYWS